MSSFISKFVGFLTKHSAEASAISDAMMVIASALPINRDDKAKIILAGQTLNDASRNIMDSIDAVSKATSDVKLPTMTELKKAIQPALDMLVADAVKSAQASADEIIANAKKQVAEMIAETNMTTTSEPKQKSITGV